MIEKDNLIHQWFSLAEHDLGTAKIIFLNLPEYYEIVAFHCQQSIEKYIKGLLVFYGVSFEKSHDLVYLKDLLVDNVEIEKALIRRITTLKSYAVQLRYPNNVKHLEKSQLEEAINTAEEMRKIAEKIISNS